jgi:hypothetical protein
MDSTLREKFLTKTEDSGRFIVTSVRTGREYAVEPILGNRVKWGDLDPATKKLQGNYGQKYKGGVEPGESMVTKENFAKVHDLEPGISPHAYIEQLDAQYPDKTPQ